MEASRDRSAPRDTTFMAAPGRCRAMRAAASLALLGLALVVPPAQAGLPDLTPVCIPEQATLCYAQQVLCPALGGTAGWCVQVEAASGGAEAAAVAGNWRVPRAGADAALAWPDADEDGAPEPHLALGARGDACLDVVLLLALDVQPPVPLPALACSFDEAWTFDVEG